MVVKSLDLKNFRNYHELHIDFDPFTNIFYGNNAQGKTNILESVYLGGTTKSHKGSKDRDMITVHGGGIPYPYAGAEEESDETDRYAFEKK